jgi:hypothetical protein
MLRTIARLVTKIILVGPLLAICALLITSSPGWSYSCHEGRSPCVGHTPPGAAGVGENSCNGDYACYHSTGYVSDHSCDGDSACYQANLSIPNDSCDDYHACYALTGHVGAQSCNGPGACCHTPVGVSGCVVNPPKQNNQQIQNNSCSGNGACKNNTGAIGNNSCHGLAACDGNQQDIPDNQCNGDYACLGPGATRPGAKRR